MKANIILFLCLLFSSCLGQFSNAAARQKVCLYGSASSTVLTPLQLKNTDCPTNTSYCMNTVYKYDPVNWRYGGPNSLKPVSGEVAMFLSQDQQGILDYVCFLNAAVTTQMNVTVQITGAEPVPIILKDDPAGDVWRWDESQNKGSFLWNTQPAFTDGVVMGHITFTDNYCVRSSFRQTSGTGVAINKLSVFTGTVAKPTRVISVNYSPGSTFEFCQYPRTAIVSRNATCPNTNDGSATVSLVFGPPSSTYTWYNHAGDVIAQNSATVNNLAPGTYHVVVNDTSTTMGCMAERSVQIEAPFLYTPLVSTQPFSCSVKGSASVTPVGGSSSFTYEWKKGQTIIGTGSSVSNLDIGSYSVCVSDSCQSKECTTFSIETSGCCGDGICQVNEVCGSAEFCAADCGVCCQPGTFKDGNSCKVCPPGSRSTTYQAESCTSCPANTNNAGGADVCTECPANTYSSAGSNKCEPCAPGTVRPAAASSCGPCPDGQYADPCGNGCVNTPSGTFAESGAWGPSSCAPGTFSSAGQSECTPCAKGSYSGAKASSCTPCSSGTTPGVGATHALFCA